MQRKEITEVSFQFNFESIVTNLDWFVKLKLKLDNVNLLQELP